MEDPTTELAEGDHLSIVESAAFRYQIEKTRGDRTEYYVIPMVAADWNRGEPIRLLLKVNRPLDIYGSNPVPPDKPNNPSLPRSWRRTDAAPTPDPVPVLIRIGGTLSALETHRFENLAADYHVGFVVPSADGKPLQYRFDYLTPTWVLCGAASFFAILYFACYVFWLRHNKLIR